MKVFICNGRCGSSLLFKLIKSSNKLQTNDVIGGEIPNLGCVIRNNYHKINFEIIKSSFPSGENILVKCPEFTLIGEELLNRYKDSKLIVIDRQLEDLVRSHVSLGWHNWLGPRLTKEFKEEAINLKFLDPLYKNDNTMLDIAWFKLLIYKSKKLKGKRVYHLNFDKWMKNFVQETEKIYKFLDLEYNEKTRDKWISLRSQKQQATARNLLDTDYNKKLSVNFTEKQKEAIKKWK